MVTETTVTKAAVISATRKSTSRKSPRPAESRTKATAALVALVSVDAIATFAILASMGSDIRIITRTTAPMTMHTPITTTMLIKASIILGTTERLDQVT
jgi:hypothetical protein